MDYILTNTGRDHAARPKETGKGPEAHTHSILILSYNIPYNIVQFRHILQWHVGISDRSDALLSPLALGRPPAEANK